MSQRDQALADFLRWHSKPEQVKELRAKNKVRFEDLVRITGCLPEWSDEKIAEKTAEVSRYFSAHHLGS